MSFDEAKLKLKELLGEAVEELVGRGPSGEADDCGSGLLSKNWKDRADAIAGLADAFASKGQRSAIQPEAVADVVVHAATCARPKPRYFAPRSAGLQTRLLGLLPESLLDRILHRLYQIETPRE